MGKSESPVLSLVLGIILIAIGGFELFGKYIPDAVVESIPQINANYSNAFPSYSSEPGIGALILLPMGIIISIMSIISIRRGAGKPKTYTEEDIARSKEILRRMHLKEHGYLPKDEDGKQPEEKD